MFIEPQTNIKILHNVPLDESYDHTVWFANINAQTTAFLEYVKYNLTNYSYQRVKRGYARVGIKAENLYDCNYMMFQNTAFGNKWFYAFIKSVEYINNETTQIEFQLDPMQTWAFNYELEQCWIDREHSVHDTMFENCVPENLELGEYVINNNYHFDMSSMYIGMLRSLSADGQPVVGTTRNNVYTALGITGGIPVSDPTAINGYIRDYVSAGREDAIRQIFQYPTFMGDATVTQPATRTVSFPYNHSTIDGYTPKNRKLFTYPYNMLLVSNNGGEIAEYKWEQWGSSEDAGTFEIKGSYIPMPQTLCYPTSYRRKTKDYDSGIAISNFPQCPWIGDAYQQWLAQNKNSTVTGIVGSAVGSIAALATTPFTGGAGAVAGAAGLVSTGMKVASTVAKVYDLKNTPPQVHGQTQTESLSAGMGRVGYTFQQLTVRGDFARIIDEYFSAYGYKTNRLKVPNTHSRPHWNYVKTVGCCLKGINGLPCDDAKKICSIYDNGITFWKNIGEVGNYSLSNNPT